MGCEGVGLYAQDGYSVHELADRFGLSYRTIQKYRQQGLIPPPTPRRGPLARYGLEHVERIQAIRDIVHDGRVTKGDLSERPWHPHKGWDC